MARRTVWSGIAAAVALVGLLAGCQTVVYPNQPDMVGGKVLVVKPPPEAPEVAQARLCVRATELVQQLAGEILAAEPADILQQTVESFAAYALELRALATTAPDSAQRQKIEAAAEAAGRHADAVRTLGAKANLDDESTADATRAAFPGCTFKRDA
jgi:hypothetical protein